VFFYSPDRGGEHPEQHLAGYAGLMQADAYAGFGKLYYANRKEGPIVEAACWAPRGAGTLLTTLAFKAQEAHLLRRHLPKKEIVDLADRTQPAIPVEIQQVMSAILLGSISMRPHNGFQTKEDAGKRWWFPATDDGSCLSTSVHP
jgi:hypothetical protein